VPVNAGKSYWRRGLNTTDLLVLTSLDQLLFILKILFMYLTKQATLSRRSTVLSLPCQLVFPGSCFYFPKRGGGLFQSFGHIKWYFWMSPYSQMTLFQSCKNLKPGADPIQKLAVFQNDLNWRKRKNVSKDVISTYVLTFPIMWTNLKLLSSKKAMLFILCLIFGFLQFFSKKMKISDAFFLSVYATKNW
jgi:hypothetical protein